MMRFACDQCGKQLDPDSEHRYVVRIEVSTSLDPLESDESPDDRDYLQEIHEILERGADSPAAELDGMLPDERQYDLCQECARRFLKNPLGRKPAKQFNFSEN